MLEKLYNTLFPFFTLGGQLWTPNLPQPTALQPLNYTNIFPQGQYLVSEKNGKLKPGKYEFSLITPNVVSYVYIIDKNNIERFSKRFNSEEVESKGKENVSLLTVGNLLEGDTIIIYGKGEMYFNLIEN